MSALQIIISAILAVLVLIGMTALLLTISLAKFNKRLE